MNKNISKNNAKWPADEVSRRNVSDLIPYARNARTHSDAQISQIAASIREWGWTVPILIDEDGGLIAGHGRLLAAQKLGIDDVPVMVASGWTEAQRRAYVIADNQLALVSDWDRSTLSNELADLNETDFNLDLLGFDADSLTGLMFDPMFDAGTEDDQSKLDELEPNMTTCPHCGEEYDLREQE